VTRMRGDDDGICSARAMLLEQHHHRSYTMQMLFLFLNLCMSN
jgi:hypothetical protein